MATKFSWHKHLWIFSQDSLRESLFRNTGIPYRNRNLIGLLLGYTSSTLLLSSGALTSLGAALWFVGTLALTMLFLILVRPYREETVDRFAWGLLVIITLGFGLGALIHGYRAWWKWLWQKYLLINTPEELLLEALFLLGVILGFFVVRNWAKEQKDFLSSLSAVLGGAFVATILGKIQGEGVDQIGAMRAFAFYALGFTMSGTMNLIVAARLTANYINRRSVSSRAMLDFLYGSERTKLIDGYFLKNFKEDPDYAKRWLTDTLIEHRRLIRREFAEKMQERKKDREKERKKFVNEMVKRWRSGKAADELQPIPPLPSVHQPATEAVPGAGGSPPPPSPPKDLECLDRECLEFEVEYVKLARKRLECRSELQKSAAALKAGEPPDEATVDEILKVLEERRIELEPVCGKLIEAEDEAKKLRTENESIKSLTELKSRRKEIAKRLGVLDEEIGELTKDCCQEQKRELRCLERILGRLKPSYYYELIAIECEETKGDAGKTAPAVPEKDREYGIIYRHILSTDRGSADDPAHQKTIHEGMFRVGIAMRWQDTLQYIVAPGQYGASFPVMGSVAGLALLMGQTIVMDRDRNKKFRSKDYGRGVCPAEIEQPRGLDEITFLSYFSIPVVARMGSPDENALGISNIDTKLFVTRAPLRGDEVEGSEGFFRSRLKQKELTRFASNLYEEEDKAVKYVEDHTKIITPVLELYAKCRVGAP